VNSSAGGELPRTPFAGTLRQCRIAACLTRRFYGHVAGVCLSLSALAIGQQGRCSAVDLFLIHWSNGSVRPLGD
jgi:hypothetical protein